MRRWSVVSRRECLVATGWLLVQRRVASRWQELLAEPRLWFARHLAWLPVVAVTVVIGMYAIRHGMYAFTDEIYEHPSWAYVFFYESVKLTLFSSLWLCIIFVARAPAT
jgi:hypothetical protein